MEFNETAKSELARKDVDFVCDRDTGRIWVLHGKPFMKQEKLTGALFSKKTGIFGVIADDGTTQDIPVPVQEPLRNAFGAAPQVTVIWASDKGDVYEIHVLPLRQR